MPTRPVENPQRPGYSGDLGAVSNLGDYPAFGGMNEWGSGDWPGTAAMNPWDVPEGIDFHWEFSPQWADEWPGAQGTAPGQGDLPDMGYDADFVSRYGAPQGMGFDPTPEAARGAGFDLQFNPGIAANRGWGLDYSLMAPEGSDQYGQGRLPWRLSSEQEFEGWPWVSGDQSFVRQEEYNPPDNTNTIGGVHTGLPTVVDVPKLPWNPDDTQRPPDFDLKEDPDDPAGGIPTHLDDLWMALTGQIPGRGDVARTMSEVPMVPPGWEDRTRVEVGQDPLSQGITSALAQLTGQSGGVADTPLARQSEQALRQIIFQGGRGAENLSDLGYTTTDALQEIIEAQGARAAETTTPLGDETQRLLRELMQSRGEGAEQLTPLGSNTAEALQEIIGARGAGAAESATPLGTDLQENLRQLMASGGQLPDVKRRAMEMETLRDPIEAFRQAQLSQGQATMADRGLLGQGPELDYMQRLEAEMAPMYAGAGQQLALGEAERADTRYREAMQQSNLMAIEQARQREGRLETALGEAGETSREQARLRENRLQTVLDQSNRMAMDQARLREDRLGTALAEAGDFSIEQAELREGRLSDALSRSTGWNEEAARNLVSAARAGTEHQQMLGDLAVKNIQENRLWNDMLYRAGIERAQALDLIQRGNLNALLPVIQEYLQAASRIGDAYVTG